MALRLPGAAQRRPAWIAASGAPLLVLALLVAVELALGYTVNTPRLLVLYLVGLAGLAIGLAALLRPHQAVMAMLFLLFTGLSDVYGPRGGLLTVNQLVVGLFLASMLVLRLTRREGLIFDRVIGGLLAYAVAVALSDIFGLDRGSVVTQVNYYLREALIMFVVLNLVTSLDGLRWVHWTLIGGAAFLCVAALIFAKTGFDFGGLVRAQTTHLAGNDFGERLAGPLGDTNDFARTLVTIVPLALYRFWDARHPLLRLAALTALLLVSAVIVLTFSRGGNLALVVVLAIAVLMRRVRPAYLLTAALALGVMAFAAPSTYWERMDATIGFIQGRDTALSDSDSSLHDRSMLWRVGVNMFLDHPLTGVGLGNYLLAYPRYAFEVSPELTMDPEESHSMLVQIAAQAGILGLAAFTVTLLLAIANARWAKRRFLELGNPRAAMLAEAAEIAIYGHLAASMFLNDSYLRYLFLIFGLAVLARQVALRTAPAASPALRAPMREGTPRVTPPPRFKPYRAAPVRLAAIPAGTRTPG